MRCNTCNVVCFVRTKRLEAGAERFDSDLPGSQRLNLRLVKCTVDSNVDIDLGVRVRVCMCMCMCEK